jgi:hypothetical protein
VNDQNNANLSVSIETTSLIHLKLRRLCVRAAVLAVRRKPEVSGEAQSHSRQAEEFDAPFKLRASVWCKGYFVEQN